ncbi:coiled-coil domain-containing protein 92-like [Diadema antillarum]|uniref:coiled-coil domain-containing protein 92-like n=1 Tax=Diadema antillarum TaxID=105358 RepID=UPI003A85C271
MAAPIEVKLRNAESSILFMQQEHAKTLQALHQELHKLQKKCAELTFELAMKSDDVDEEQYTSEISSLKERLESKEKQCNQLSKERDSYSQKCSDIELQMKEREKAYQGEISEKGQRIIVLTAELDQRSGTIAYLTTQLHQLKLKQQGHPEDQTARAEPPERISSPAPPKEPAPPRVRRFNLRTGNGPVPGAHVRTNRHVRRESAPPPNQVQSHMFSRIGQVSPASPGYRQRDEVVRDVAAFIAHVDPTGKEVEVKPAPAILPPIAPHESVSREYAMSAEIATLAIEKPFKVDSTLRSPNHSPVHTD